MLALLGSRAPPRRRGRNLQAPNWASHEAKVTPYPPLPDVMVTNAGTKVTTAREWWEVRRPELVELFDREVYGRMPKTLPKVSWAVTRTTDDTIGGVAMVRQELLGTVDDSRYPPGPTWQEQVVAKGWGYASLRRTSVQADNGGGRVEGIIGLANQGQPRKVDDWGALPRTDRRRAAVSSGAPPRLHSRPVPITIYPASATELRAWFEQHGATADEVIVGYYKRHTGKPSPTWSESVDEALCFGWIDGIRRSVDADRFTNRFTPRRKGSNWSQINIRKVEALIAAKKMTPAGLAAFEGRTPAKTGRSSYEQRPHAFPPGHLKVFKANPAAWTWFETQPPGYRRLAIWYVVSAVRPETQAKRLGVVIDASAARRRIIGNTGATVAAPAAKPRAGAVNAGTAPAAKKPPARRKA